MKYWARATAKLTKPRNLNDTSPLRDDFVHGQSYLEAVQHKEITDDTIVLMLSGDGAQLYRDKQSDVWIFIWCIFEYPPWLRYKVKSVIPDTIIPGPAAPKNHISCSFPSMYHLAALQNEGLKVWKADSKHFTTKQLFLAFCGFDAVALASMWGWVGHNRQHLQSSLGYDTSWMYHYAFHLMFCICQVSTFQSYLQIYGLATSKATAKTRKPGTLLSCQETFGLHMVYLWTSV